MSNHYVGLEEGQGLPYHSIDWIWEPKVRPAAWWQVQILVRALPPHFLYSTEYHGTEYGFDLELFGEIVVEDSKWNTKGRNVICSLAKKDVEAEYWSRLTKDKAKNPNI